MFQKRKMQKVDSMLPYYYKLKWQERKGLCKWKQIIAFVITKREYINFLNYIAELISKQYKCEFV